MARGDSKGTAIAAAGIILPKGLSESRLFSGAAARLETALSKASGLDVTVTSHTVGRFISRALTEGGSLAGVTTKQLAKTLQHGEVYKDAVTGSYLAVRKDVAIAYTLQKGKVVVRTIEPAKNIKEGERFTHVTRPF
jgi:hypothetical protein